MYIRTCIMTDGRRTLFQLPFPIMKSELELKQFQPFTKSLKHENNYISIFYQYERHV